MTPSEGFVTAGMVCAGMSLVCAVLDEAEMSALHGCTSLLFVVVALFLRRRGR